LNKPLKLIIKKIPPKGYHIFVKGKIQGIEVKFLIDTGASKSVVDRSFTEKHFKDQHIIKTEHQTTGLGANIQNSEFVKFNRLKIGTKSIKPLEFALIDLDMVNAAYTAAGLDPVYAIIGGDILMKYKCVIDYKNAYLIFHK
jgi:hypothetical protein